MPPRADLTIRRTLLALACAAALAACSQPERRGAGGPDAAPRSSPTEAPAAPARGGAAPIAGTLRIGLIADCQYADQPDSGQRLYRRAPDKLRAAVADLEAARPAFTVHLGDFIDRNWESFDVVEPLYQALTAPALHVLGNHDFEVGDARKDAVPARMGIPTRYRDFAQAGWRFVLLDTNDVSLHAHRSGSPAQRDARAWKEQHAPHSGDSGGGLGIVQLAWLDTVLAEADAAGEFVVTMSHHPLLPDGPAAAWNAAEVRAILAAHPSAKLHLAGHDHAGAYAEWRGIHFLTLHGMLDTPETAYATLDLAPDLMRVDGRGRAPDRELRVR